MYLLTRGVWRLGAFAAVFVPMYNRRMTEAERQASGSGLAAANVFAGQVLSVLLPFLLVFTTLMMAATAPVVLAMTGGFPDGGPAKFALAARENAMKSVRRDELTPTAPTP